MKFTDLKPGHIVMTKLKELAFIEEPPIGIGIKATEIVRDPLRGFQKGKTVILVKEDLAIALGCAFKKNSTESIE